MLSIAIVSLDNVKYVELLLKGLRRNTVNPFELLIHCNCVSKAFFDLILKNEDIIHVFGHSSINRYVGDPVNDLFKFASYDNFVFLDDDVYPAPGWDEALLKKVNPDILHQYLAPAQFSPTSTERTYFNLHDFGGAPSVFREDDFNTTWKESRNIIKDHTMIAGNFIIKRALWESIGGFDASLEKSEDIEFKIRIWKDAVSKGLPFEFRTVADSCLYHFCNVGNRKADILNPRRINAVAAIMKRHKVSPSEWELFTQGLNTYFER